MLEWLLAVALLPACEAAVRPLIAAHRGGMDSGHPENTLPAFRHAGTSGAHVVELDLRATADGEIVVLHDSRVDRTTDGFGAVRELSLDAVKRLDTGGGITIPTLAEVLETTRALDVELLFDIKRAARLDHERLVSMVREGFELDRVIFGVRTLEDRAALADAHPRLRFLGFVRDTADIGAFVDAGVDAVRLWPGWLERDPALVGHLHERGARVWVTAGTASMNELTALAHLGADALLTDYPVEAAKRFGCT